MLSQKDNEMRNKIMVNIRFEQQKLSNLKEVMRQEKIKVMKLRDKKSDTQQVNYLDLMKYAKNQEEKDMYKKLNENGKKQQVTELKNNYMSYIDDKMKQDHNQVKVTQTYDVDLSNKLPKRPKNKSTDSVE